MTKVMVVEDDQSLREIYSIRLTAEGYEIVSAGDGEEALALAVKEKPDLILSDVMMPKISGFDMLDILRQTPETKGIKVIMMTALSSDDQRKRGEGLGADKYLVKSQVGIEDVIAAVHEVLGDNNEAGAPVSPEMLAAAQLQEVTAQTQPVAPPSDSQVPVSQSVPTPTQPQPVAQPQPSVQQPAPQPMQPVQGVQNAQPQPTPVQPAQPANPAQ